MDYSIDNKDVEKSFDRIALELLRKSLLIVNDIQFEITEIEFYYFHEKYHPDKYTHEHDREVGEWRFHNQGIDITLQSGQGYDGGILLRGLKQVNSIGEKEKKYINGPRKILMRVFEKFGKVYDENVLKIDNRNEDDYEIIKTFRHLPNKIHHKDFHNKYYRYLTDLGELDISKSIKTEIKQKSEKL
ncbi:MAG: hypothetical protein L3J35_12965 [Bacteroidales bacterium]|nr:hypothetical protein [Bacteroidales bacterium]